MCQLKQGVYHVVATARFRSEAGDVRNELRVLLHQGVGTPPPRLGCFTHGEQKRAVEVFGPSQAMKEIIMIGGICLGGTLPIPVAQQAVTQQTHVAQGA